MSYHQDNLKRLKNVKLFFFILAVGIFFYFFSNLILVKGFDLLSYIASPIWRLERRVIGDFYEMALLFKSKELLQIENERLVLELDNIKKKLDSLDSLEVLNDELMVSMGRNIPDRADSILAVVLSGPNIPPYESLIIDVGKKQGVSIGNRVIYPPNIILGEVVSVFDQTSKVKLYSANGVQTDVLITFSEILHSVVSGSGGGNFWLELPSNIPIYKGMQVFVPGVEGYVLGTVDFVKIDPTKASEQILMRYPINIKNIRFVHVIRSSQRKNLE